MVAQKWLSVFCFCCVMFFTAYGLRGTNQAEIKKLKNDLPNFLKEKEKCGTGCNQRANISLV